ncbi:hypothetical protein JCM8208_004416 [Rhodotorula glutinis]
MSDRLDDDVLLLILDELATPSSDYYVYCIGKKALYNVCLASSRLRRLAQPRLFRQIWVVERPRADGLLPPHVVTSLGRIATWHIVGKPENEDSLPKAVDMTRVLPNVEEFRLSRPHPTSRLVIENLVRIEGFTKLRHLSLVHAPLSPSNMICTMPLLQELDLYWSCAFLPDTAVWLKPVYLPALRILSVVDYREWITPSPPELSEVLGPDMLTQLDVLQTDHHTVDSRSALAVGTAPPVLFFDPPCDKPALLRHSIHPLEGDINAVMKWNAVRPLADALERSVSSSAAVGPRVVVFPRRILSLAAQHPKLDMAVRGLEQTCARDVRIIWSGDEGMDLFSGGISPEFVRYARELKAAQQEAAT